MARYINRESQVQDLRGMHRRGRIVRAVVLRVNIEHANLFGGVNDIGVRHRAEILQYAAYVLFFQVVRGAIRRQHIARIHGNAQLDGGDFVRTDGVRLAQGNGDHVAIHIAGIFVGNVTDQGAVIFNAATRAALHAVEIPTHALVFFQPFPLQLRTNVLHAAIIVR